jgi:hypothetical protein
VIETGGQVFLIWKVVLNKEIKSRLHLGNAWYHSVEHPVYSHLLSKRTIDWDIQKHILLIFWFLKVCILYLICGENINCYAFCTDRGSSLICMSLCLNVLKQLNRFWWNCVLWIYTECLANSILHLSDTTSILHEAHIFKNYLYKKLLHDMKI